MPDITLRIEPNAAETLRQRMLAETAAANADATAQSIRAATLNLWPDPFFALSGDQLGTMIGGRSLYPASLFPNMAWDGLATHAFGKGAWVMKEGVAGLGGGVLWFDGKGVSEGDTITLAARVQAVAGTDIVVACRFVDDAGAYLGGQVENVFVVASGGTDLAELDPVVVPAGAAGVALYANDGATPGDIALIDMMGAKGTSIEALSNISTGGASAAAAARISRTKSDWAAIEIDEIDYDSALNRTPATDVALSSRTSLTFTGWARTFAKADLGGAFNAVHLQIVGRPDATVDEWATINVVVRTHATDASQAGATVVATGSVRVNPSEGAIENVVVPLRDPSNNALLDVELADLEADVLVGYYALTEAGDGATIIETLGSIADPALRQSYYIVAARDALTDAWSTYTANFDLGIELLDTVGLVQSVTYTASDALKIAVGGGSDGTVNLDLLAVPPVLYGIVDAGAQAKEVNLYLDNIVAGAAADYAWDMTGSYGELQDERWTLRPDEAVASSNLTINVRDRETQTLRGSAGTALQVADYPPAVAKNWTVLVIGDSLVAGGEITQTLLDLAGEASSNTTVSLIGTRGTVPNLHEGRGGYRIDDFAGTGRVFRSFTVTGVTIPPLINSSSVTYTHNGRTYTPQDVILDGSGNGEIIFSDDGAGSAPDASGTLTKVGAGAGDATITFTATAEVPGSPFWNSVSGGLDFAGYLTDHSFAAPDWVFISLGINSVASLKSDAAVESQFGSDAVDLEALIANITAADAGIKVALCITTPGVASQDGAGAAYGLSISAARYKRNILLYGQALVEQFDDRTAERIWLVGTNVGLDPVHGFDRPLEDANARSSEQVPRATNLVHPGLSGKQQMADVIYAAMQVVG